MKFLWLCFCLIFVSQVEFLDALKIYPKFDFDSSVPLPQQNWFKEVIWPPVAKWFEASLSLSIPMTGKLKIADSDWDSEKIRRCSDFTKPPEIFGSSTGVDAEYYHIFTLEGIDENYHAKTNFCARDSHTGLGLPGRPLVGFTRLNLSTFIDPQGVGGTHDYHYNKQILILMHEITHSLVFHNSHFPFFLDTNMSTPTRLKYTPITWKTTDEGYNLTFLNATKVVQYLQRYHQNSHVPGLALEYEGSGAHINARYYPHDFMTRTPIAEMRTTGASLSVFNASGWYTVSYYAQEPYTFGYGIGEDPELKFWLGTKGELQAQYPEYFQPLTPDYQKNCSYFQKSRGNTKNFSENSFNGGLTYLGAKLPSKDDCWDQSNANDDIQTYGLTSRCFIGNFSKNGGQTYDKNGYCLRYQCRQYSNGSYVVSIPVGGTEFFCWNKEKKQTIFGALECPNAEEFCRYRTDGLRAWGDGHHFCVRGCMGGYGGTCTNWSAEGGARCVCKPSFVGADCSINSTRWNPYT